MRSASSVSPERRVATTPGAKALQVMLCSASARAAAWVSAFTANFEAQYGAKLGYPCRPAIEDVLMIFPTARGDHAPGTLLDSEQGPEAVDVHDGVPVLLGDVEEVHRLVESGVVEQDVEAAREASTKRSRQPATVRAVASHRPQGPVRRPPAATTSVAAASAAVERRGRARRRWHPRRRAPGEGATHPTAGAGDDDGERPCRPCSRHAANVLRSGSSSDERGDRER